MVAFFVCAAISFQCCAYIENISHKLFFSPSDSLIDHPENEKQLLPVMVMFLIMSLKMFLNVYIFSAKNPALKKNRHRDRFLLKFYVTYILLKKIKVYVLN